MLLVGALNRAEAAANSTDVASTLIIIIMLPIKP
jgi:hypothetical protein